jgi:signal transduction histidine kinase
VAGDHTRGSGLGLAISRAIVEHHQGSITLSDAHPGDGQPGLAVVIKLPLPQRPAAGEQTALKSSLSFGGAS